MNLLAECQNAALSIGNSLEEEKETECIPLLESYCEDLFQLTEKDGIEKKEIDNLNRSIQEVQKNVQSLLSKYLIVFLPYKVQMWDSLESIWRAFDEDDNCESVVVPIPYGKRNLETQEWEPNYEGALYPDYVPVTYFGDFDIKKQDPDIVFIHNPFDKYNYVVSVDPKYYSYELKKYVRCLVYVPYYVTTGALSKHSRNSSVNFHMDYMICQSEFTKELCKNEVYYEKMLPFGSPKFDRVHWLMNQNNLIPVEWKERLKGKKILMLNTSINCFLEQREVMFQKLLDVFKWAKQRKDIALIYRPHPLLESTIRAMHPDLIEQYETMMTYFNKENVGILDQTADISRIVALSDAYIGEFESSVCNLFLVAKKPVFVLNNFLISDSLEQKESFNDAIIVDDNLYTVINNMIYSMNLKTCKIHFEAQISRQHFIYNNYSSPVNINGTIYFSPSGAFAPVSFHIRSKRLEFLLPNSNLPMGCGRIVSHEKKLFYLCAFSFNVVDYRILEYDIEKNAWKNHIDCINNLISKGYTPRGDVCYDGRIIKGILYVTITFTNLLLCLDIDTGKYSYIELGEKNSSYSAIEADGKELWIAENSSGRIIRFNTETQEYRTYDMPNEFKVRENYNYVKLAHLSILDMGKYIITAPQYANSMVRINKEDGKTDFLAKEFWAETALDNKDFYAKYNPSATFLIKLNDIIVLSQRSSDKKFIWINIETGDYETKEAFCDNSWKTACSLEKAEQFLSDYGWYFRENKYYRLDEFANDLVNRIQNDDIDPENRSLSHLTSNLDGSAGKKTKEFFLKKLNESGCHNDSLK